MKPETRYIITFLSKKGKVKSRVGCNTENTVCYIIRRFNDYGQPGIAIVLNTETGEENCYER